VGSPGSTVETPRWGVSRRGVSAPFPAYRRLEGPVPVIHAPRLAEAAQETRDLLALGSDALAEIVDVDVPGSEPPQRDVSTGLVAFLVAAEDWDGAPRDNRHPYPPGLPYFTRSVEPPALVLPERLSPVFRPRTGMQGPLAVWHELAHAFLLRREVVRTPAWLGELVPQAASAAVARRAGLPLEEHLRPIDRDPGFTVRGFGGRASAEDQMKFQNLLLLFGAAALDEFGEAFLGRLFRTLWEEDDVVDEKRAEHLLAGSLGAGGAAWLSSRPEF
jgi:hypothetical protein